MTKQFLVVTSQTILTSVLIAITLNIGFAQVMSSSNYQIQSDSINAGGGFSSSTNFLMESTVGEIATGQSASTDFTTRAGFQQMQEVYLAITAPAHVSLSPSIPGVTGGTSTGATSVRVTTDNIAGYQLTIQSSNSPAMQSGGNTISDYVPAGVVPDYEFTIGAADAYFGFSPEGPDVVDRFLDSGGVCGSGSDTANRCWDGLSTSEVAIARSTGSNHPTGASTTIQFQVGLGGSVLQPPGEYVATTTLTAIPL
jgi:hypothetical protein